MSYFVNGSRGMGALSVSDEGPLRRAIIHAEELAQQVGQELGEAAHQGLITQAQMTVLDESLAVARNVLADLDARVSTISAQEIPAVQSRIDQATAEIESIRTQARREQSSGLSSLVRRTGFWVGLGLVTVGIGGAVIWSHASKRGRRRRSR